MTQSRTPPTKPSIPVPRRAPTDGAPAPDDIPRGEFIDVVSHKPVEPGRLQVFPVSEEFLNRVRANKPPQLRSDDIKDTVPRGLPQQRASERAPASATAPIASPNETQRPSTAPNLKAESSQRRARAGVQPPPSALTRWALTGKIPGRVKVALGAVIGALVLLLVWENWTPDDSDADTDVTGDSTTPAASAVPLLDVPSVAEPVAAEQRESPTAALKPTASAVPIENRPASEPAVLSAPQVAANAPKSISSQAAAASPGATNSALVSKNATSSAAPTHSVAVAAASAKPKLIPLFEPR